MKERALQDRELVREQLARYVRATDRRDTAAMGQLFTPDGRVGIFFVNAGTPERLGVLEGRQAIFTAVKAMMAPHPPRGWSHHTTFNHIIELDGDTAEMDAQFVVYAVVGRERPAEGWPAGAAGAQGSITPIESGYYRSTLHRRAEGWLFTSQRIFHDLPLAF